MASVFLSSLHASPFLLSFLRPSLPPFVPLSAPLSGHDAPAALPRPPASDAVTGAVEVPSCMRSACADYAVATVL